MKTLATLLAVFAMDTDQGQTVAVARVAPDAIRETAPALADYTDRVLFADVWARADLSPRDRSLITVSSLVTTGDFPQLRSHIARALDNGVRPEEISGAIVQLAFYAGWPAAMSAAGEARAVFADRGITALEAGQITLPYGPDEPQRAAGVAATVAPTAPALAAYTDQVLFDDLWRRDDLTPRDRSLVTVASLVAAGSTGQLRYHLARARTNGLERAEAVEAVTHLAFYAGWPKAMSAVPVIREVFAD